KRRVHLVFKNDLVFKFIPILKVITVWLLFRGGDRGGRLDPRVRIIQAHVGWLDVHRIMTSTMSANLVGAHGFTPNLSSKRSLQSSACSIRRTYPLVLLM